jgi:hypothetical protein
MYDMPTTQRRQRRQRRERRAYRHAPPLYCEYERATVSDSESDFCVARPSAVVDPERTPQAPRYDDQSTFVQASRRPNTSTPTATPANAPPPPPANTSNESAKGVRPESAGADSALSTSPLGTDPGSSEAKYSSWSGSEALKDVTEQVDHTYMNLRPAPADRTYENMLGNDSTHFENITNLTQAEEAVAVANGKHRQPTYISSV